MYGTKQFNLIFLVLLLSFLAILSHVIVVLLIPDKLFVSDPGKNNFCVSEDTKKQVDFTLDQVQIARGELRHLKDYRFNKLYQLNGEIIKSGIAIGGRPYVQIQIGNYNNIGCFYNPNFTKELNQRFKDGQKICVFGVFKGEILNNYIFVNCQFSCK